MGSRAAPPKIIMDVTDLCCWTGRATGIIRVDRELATWAQGHLDRITFAVFDPHCNAYRALREPWLDLLLAGRCHINRDELRLSEAEGRSERRPMRAAARWVLRFRREYLNALEARRVATPTAWVANGIDRLQRIMMTEKYRRLMIRPDGSRYPRVAVAEALGEPVRFSAGDILLSIGSAWVDSNIEAVAALKRAAGVRYVMMCHDIILLQFPQYADARVADEFRRHVHVAFPLADLVLCASSRVAGDVQRYCADHGLGELTIAKVPFGGDPTCADDSVTGEVGHHGLEAGKFILHVSTIEPRKGHRVVLEAWRRLLAAETPQRHGFKLVLVGQFGWKIEQLRADLESEAAAGRLTLLSNVDDTQLTSLYRQCAFCVYPSEYEGFGLPVVEAFRHGKAVIASNGGALPEVTSGFAPCLDPFDVQGWTDLMGRWIADPGARRVYETAIRDNYRPVSWNDAAARVFATIDEELAGTRSEMPRGLQ